MLDVLRAVSFYVARIASFRHTEAMFVLYRRQGYKQGYKVFPSTVSFWVREAIETAYKACRINPPLGIVAHTFRGVATPVAFDTFPTLEAVKQPFEVLHITV